MTEKHDKGNKKARPRPRFFHPNKAGRAVPATLPSFTSSTRAPALP
jgi:hypothetical protein